MNITMVKKIMEDGQECKKCREVSERLESGGELAFINKIIYADMRDPSSEGHSVAEKHNINIAPFFVVEEEGQVKIYKTYMELKRKVFNKMLEEADIEIEEKRKATSSSSAVDFMQYKSKVTSSPSPMPQINIDQLNSDYENKTPQELLSWSLKEFHPSIALAWSGAEDVALVDMMVKINPQARIFTLDTGRLNEETYQLIDRVREKYSINVEVLYPEAEQAGEMVRQNGINLFYDSIEKRKLCCNVRKVQPLTKMLSSMNAWITGLRRDQSVTRTVLKKIEIDHAFGGIVKINPLAGWSHDDLWNYIRENDVPFNELHEKGYPSIGCAPCTRAVKEGEDIRAGRWWWEEPESKECGLHIKSR